MKRLPLRVALLCAGLLAAFAMLAGCGISARVPAPTHPADVPSAVSPTTAESSDDTSPTMASTGAVPVVGATTFAIIGDYGVDGAHERDVANLVASWQPAFILTTGDDYYPHAGGAGTGKYDNSTGAYYGAWLKDFTTTGARYPVGTAPLNAFFPTLGNHDYSDPGSKLPLTYLAYFRLPGAAFANTSGNERYYDFVEGPIHFFALNSCAEEPDGTSVTSKQAKWLQQQLAASTSTWNIVYDHHPPFASDLVHGSSGNMRGRSRPGAPTPCSPATRTSTSASCAMESPTSSTVSAERRAMASVRGSTAASYATAPTGAPRRSRSAAAASTSTSTT